jgi:broad specificity phosphatase PhoE
MNTFVFLRHGETTKDPTRPSIDWTLTEETQKSLTDLAAKSEFCDITHIYSSYEDKAQKSAAPFARKLRLKVEVADGLEEVHRGDTYLSDEEFAQLKREKLEQRDSAPDGAETSNEALARFRQVISAIDAKHTNAKILISSHGTILALYFSELKQNYDDIYSYWNALPFCGIGIVKNGTVLKDFNTPI